MLAAVCKTLGAPLVVERIARLTSLDLGATQVRLRVAFAALNFADALMVNGKYQVQPPLPFVGGAELSGTILEVGMDVQDLAVGDLVVALPPLGGAFAEEVCVDETLVHKLPPRLTLQTAASVPVSYGTAHVGLLHRACLQPGETLLITAAAGGTGLAALDIAKSIAGVKVIAAAGSADKLALLKARGADHCINYNTESLKDRVKQICGGGGADVIFDSVGGKLFEDHLLRCINWEGRLEVCGFASGQIPKLAANLLLVKNASVVGLYWGAYAEKNPAVMRNSIAASLAAAAQGTFQPHIGGTFPLERVNDAFACLQGRQSTGKILLRIAGEEQREAKL